MKIDHVKNFGSSLAKHTMNLFKTVDHNVKLNRLEICSSCENFNPDKRICNTCGCLLEIKTSWASEKCPIDKWNSEIEVKNQELTQSLPPSGDCGCNKK